MVFPVVMYGCESWTIKKAEHTRLDAFDAGGFFSPRATWEAPKIKFVTDG